MSTTALMTVEQFAQMHTSDTQDFELVQGELIPLPSGTLRHAKIRGLAERMVNGYFDRIPLAKPTLRWIAGSPRIWCAAPIFQSF